MTKRNLRQNTLEKQQSLRRYVVKVQSMIALFFVLSYTFMVIFYFMRGLDEANFQYLHAQSNQYSNAYNQNKPVKLPNSIHFQGYLGWDNVPTLAKEQFPFLNKTQKLTMESARINKERNTFAWPEKVIFVVAQPLNDGEIFYLIRIIDTEQYDELGKNGIVNMISFTWPLALLFLIMMHLAVHFLLKRTLKPFNQLGDWVDTLTLSDSDKTPPNFEFNELNRIARQQQSTLKRISEILSQEQDFLRHASHEMRTPIAVVKSNSELLERVLFNANKNPIEDVLTVKNNDKGLMAVARIKRAGLNMQHMTETLLWLSREQEGNLVPSQFNIAKMINHLIEDNQYLLQGKSVEISLTLKDKTLSLFETPCRLILNNLIRNAFQYTAEGDVEIIFLENEVTIKNTNKTHEVIDHSGADYGYGLGLRLVDKIINKVGWHYQNSEIEGGRQVTVTFIDPEV